MTEIGRISVLMGTSAFLDANWYTETGTCSYKVTSAAVFLQLTVTATEIEK